MMLLLRLSKWRQKSRPSKAYRGDRMTIPINKNEPHEVSEVICVKCGKRWISVRQVGTLLKDIDCPNCGKGYVIKTGQDLDA